MREGNRQIAVKMFFVQISRHSSSLLMMGALGIGFGFESFDSEGWNLIDIGVSGLVLNVFAGLGLLVGLPWPW
jgi:hypothetical protein